MAEDTVKPDPRAELNVEYANNTFFEPTVWDLKIIFGEFSGRSAAVDWHTSVTMPWAQAKLMAYYLLLNVALHELNEKMPTYIPPGLIPPELPEVAESDKSNAVAQAMHDFAVEYRKQFIENLSKMPSAKNPA